MRQQTSHKVWSRNARLRTILNIRFLRFVIVGVGNTIFGYGVFVIIFMATGSHYVGIVLATVIGVAFNFFTTGRIVFGNRSTRTALPFVVGYGVVLILNLLLIDLFIAGGLGPMPAQAMALPLVVLASYFINAWLVFRR